MSQESVNNIAASGVAPQGATATKPSPLRKDPDFELLIFGDHQPICQNLALQVNTELPKTPMFHVALESAKCCEYIGMFFRAYGDPITKLFATKKTPRRTVVLFAELLFLKLRALVATKAGVIGSKCFERAEVKLIGYLNQRDAVDDYAFKANTTETPLACWQRLNSLLCSQTSALAVKCYTPGNFEESMFFTLISEVVHGLRLLH